MTVDHTMYEISIEQRLHGAATEVSAELLDEHLATCVDCQAFATQTAGLRTMMKTTSDLTASTVDWTKLERGLSTWKGNLLRTSAGAFVASAVLEQLLPRTQFDALGFMVLVAISARLQAWWSRREARALMSAPAALETFLRTQLDAQIRAVRRDIFLFFAIAALPILSLVVGRNFELWALLGALLSAMLFAGLALRLRASVLPTLVRERANLT